MLELVGHLIPVAIGVAISPVPAVAVLVMLLTKRARSGSIILATSWIAGVVIALVVATAFAGLVREPRQGLDLRFEGSITAILGIGLMIAAAVSRKGRLRSEEPDEPPKWVNAVDGLSPAGGALVVFSNATTSPKNVALALSAGTMLRQYATGTTQVVAGSVLYILLASLTVLVPVILYFVGGARAEETIARWRAYATARAAAVMELTIFGLGIVLALKGLANLFGWA